MQPLSPKEQELIEILRSGAVTHLSESGALVVLPIDDLPPNVRDRLREAQKRRLGEGECPTCLDSEADRMLLEAETYHARGNVRAAMALEIQAAQLQGTAARLRGR